jgi:hypothetical protein
MQAVVVRRMADVVGALQDFLYAEDENAISK